MDKIFHDMILHCSNIITDNIVKGIFNNLTIVDLEWYDSYESLIDIDLLKYKSYMKETIVEFSKEQINFISKLDKVKEEFTKIYKQNKLDSEKTIKVFGINFSQISRELKLYILIGVFSFLFILFIFLLIKLNKRPSEKSEKKEKKNN